MKGTLKADRSYVIFAHEFPDDFEILFTLWDEVAKSVGYVQVFGFLNGESTMLNIMPQDEARVMYE